MALLGKKTVARKRKNRKIDIIEEHNNLVLYLNIKEIEKERSHIWHIISMKANTALWKSYGKRHRSIPWSWYGSVPNGWTGKNLRHTPLYANCARSR